MDGNLQSDLVRFYSGAGPDHRGRYLKDIQQWSDDRLEAVHDYIQWLFPLPEPSAFNAAAPVLTSTSIGQFRAQPELQQKLRASFLRMMDFYGLELHSGEKIVVTRGADFAARSRVWLSAGNHNHLRITRILRSLKLLGLEAEATAFFDCLSEIYQDEQKEPFAAISEETMFYWREAAT
jgi:Opioid growth factor receptor (OGFr) conserved region